MRDHGVQTEILLTLGVVMTTATGLMALLALQMHDAQIRAFQELIGRGLEQQARSIHGEWSQPQSDARWYLVSREGRATPLGSADGELDPRALVLATRARTAKQSLLRTDLPWRPILFATPLDDGSGAVAVAQLQTVRTGPALAGLLAADAVVFSFLGGYLLRRRVVGPLRRLADAARAFGGDRLEEPIPLEGVAEVVDAARAFNEMSAALEERSAGLEKALHELRDSNASLRRAREGLDRAERLAAVGRLAAGVAHEVGNPMGAVLAFLSLARRDEGISEASRQHLDKAVEQSERVRGILRQLLDFSRPPRPRHEAVDLAAAARQALDLTAAQSLYSEIRFELEDEAGGRCALADGSLVSQILLNLVMNAADAAAGEPPGRVRIVVVPGVLHRRGGENGSEAAARREPDAVACVVEDDGPGVAEEDRGRIFDPFFTTKAPGKGTGLGLSNALRLAEQLGGRLDCDASPELGGARFSLVLPSAEPGARGPGVRGVAAGR